MTGLRDYYHCAECGHVVEIVKEGAPVLVCCGQPMSKLEAKVEDAGTEKHLPVIEETGEGIKVKVGEVTHPMEEDHYIKFIAVQTKDKVLRAELKPSQAPEAVFCAKKEDVVAVVEYCTTHGLWKKS